MKLLKMILETSTEMNFIEALMEEIVTKGRKTPKVQVERYISPILSMFLEEILHKKYDKNYELIMPEFPIRKGTVNIGLDDKSNQSTNIDYLLYNKTDDMFTFVELKTDASSYKPSQLEIYQNLKKICKSYQEAGGATFGQLLYEDLVKIKEATTHKHKYEYLLGEWDTKYDEVNQMEIIYLVPKATNLKIEEEVKKNENKAYISQENILYFEDLAEDINHTFKSEWKTIINYMHKLDSKYTFDKIENK